MDEIKTKEKVADCGIALLVFFLIFIVSLFMGLGVLAYNAKDFSDIPFAYRIVWASLMAIGSIGFSVTLVIDGIKTDGFKADHFGGCYLMWAFVDVAIFILSGSLVIAGLALLFSMIFNTVLIFASCAVEVFKDGTDLEEDEEPKEDEESAVCEC